MSTKLVIVYTPINEVIRRAVYSSDQADDITLAHIQPGEDYFVAEFERVPPWPQDLNDAFYAKFGKYPNQPRAAMVDAKGNVINVINADANVDPAPKGYILINAPFEVGIGWYWDKDNGFKAPIVVSGD